MTEPLFSAIQITTGADGEMVIKLGPRWWLTHGVFAYLMEVLLRSIINQEARRRKRK